MIKIDIWSNAFIVDGHADYAPYGQDIVCAAVSAIIQGSLNWFDENDCNLIMKDSYISLVCHSNLNENALYFELLSKQLKAINNKDHVSVKIHKGKYNEI